MSPSRDKKRDTRNWEDYYREQDVESMPWFHPELDPDLDRALAELNIQTGTALDVGTGPGTQAIALAKRGFEVTGTDISQTATQKAQGRSQREGVSVSLKQDDILHSQISQEFDFVFDRGCFHVLSAEQRTGYVTAVSRLIKPSGFLFLKCFSRLEPEDGGPHRFAPDEIVELFGAHFEIRSIEETVFPGTRRPLPRALFCVLKKPRGKK